MTENIYIRTLSRLAAISREFEAYVGSSDNPGAATNAEVEAIKDAPLHMIAASMAFYKAACIAKEIEGKDVPR